MDGKCGSLYMRFSVVCCGVLEYSMVYTHTPPYSRMYRKVLGVLYKVEITKGIKGKLSGGESQLWRPICGAVCYGWLVVMVS